MPLHSALTQGVKLALDMRLKAPTAEVVEGVPEPEQFERLDIPTISRRPPVEPQEEPPLPPPPPQPPLPPPPPPQFFQTPPVDELKESMKVLETLGLPFKMFGAAFTDLTRGRVPLTPQSLGDALEMYLPGGEKYEEYTKWEAPGFKAPDIPKIVDAIFPPVGFALDLFTDEQGRISVKGLAEMLPFLLSAVPAAGTLIKKGTEKAVSKTFEGALNTGLDKWIARQSRILPETQSGLYRSLEKVAGHRSNWLADKATQNLLKRKGRVSEAVDDTVRDIEKLLLVEHPTVKGQTRPLADIMAELETKQPAMAGAKAELKLPKPEGEIPKVTPEVAKLQTIRSAWLQTVKGKRYTELKELYPMRLPKEDAEYRKLQDEFLELGMSSKEKGAWRREEKLLEAEDAAMEKADELYRVAEEAEDIIPKVGRVKPVTPEAPTPPTAGKPPGKPPVEVATSTQKIEAHNIAGRKALINAKGKMKPQYRRFAKAMTGKASMLKMTREEADTFIKALTELPEATVKGRKKIPPRIPILKRVTKEGFFDVEFGEPTPIRLFTSQTYYAQKLGVKPLTKPLELAKQRLDLEVPPLHRAIDQKALELNKIFKVSLKEKVAAKLKNKPTRAVTELAELINKYEDLPPEIVDTVSPETVKLFSWFRNLNRTIINGENEVRRSLGMGEIPYRQAYMRHLPDATAKAILEGTHPIPEQLKYWSQKIVGQKIFNPMEMQRQLSNDLADLFSKDLIYASKSMVSIGLKEILLSQPLDFFNQQITAYGDKLPASTRTWVTNYVNQVIKGQQTAFDAEINRMITKTGIGSVIDKFLKPFGRAVGQRPLTHMAQFMGRMQILSVMTPRPGLAKMFIRNLFQTTQDMALHGINATLKANYPATGIEADLLDKSLFIKGYTGLEELPVNIMGKIEKLALKPYGATAIFNARRGLKAAVLDFQKFIFDPKYKDLVGSTGKTWFDPQRTGTEPEGFLYPMEEAQLLEAAEFDAGITQYSYIPMDMPEIFRHKVLTPVTRLQSWWMNHYFKFHREAMFRTLSGETSQGLPLPGTMRLNYAKYLIIGGGILTSLGYDKAYLIGVLPYNLSPVGQFIIGLYNYTIAKSDYQKTRAKRTIFNSWRAFVPGSLAWKEFEDVWNGDRELRTLFFYEAEEGLPPHIPTYSIPLPEKEEEPENLEDWAGKKTSKTPSTKSALEEWAK